MAKKFALVFYCTLVILLPLLADQWDKKTTATFSRPVELPGVVLPAGTYVFKLLESTSNRHIVQVFNSSQNKVLATILAIPNWRLAPRDKTVMSFAERPKTDPEALRAWFYPGDNFGQEFVYPKQRAAEIAETAHVPVLTAEIKPTEKAEELMKEPVLAITPEKKEVDIAQFTTPAKPDSPLMAQATPAPLVELPKTATPLPILLVIGVCLLAIAGCLLLVLKSFV